jgi:hypothetical protein
MKLLKLAHVLSIITVLAGTSLSQAETAIPSNKTMAMVKNTAVYSDLPVEIVFNHNSCATDQAAEIKAALGAYDFKKALDNIGVKNVKIRVERKYSRESPLVKISKDRSTLIVKSYPFVNMKWVKNVYSVYTSQRGTHSVDGSRWEESEEGCATLTTNDLYAYVSRVTEFLAEEARKKEQKNTQAVNTPAAATVQAEQSVR